MPEKVMFRGRPVTLDGGPFIVGILNCTPDSFSDGGSYESPAAAIEAGCRMADEGVDAIDVGGESTRPGSRPVPTDEQIRRTQTVIAELARRFGSDGPALMIDTRDATVAAAALDAGAAVVNDISALRDDPAMAPLVAQRHAGVVLMHMQGTPADMQNDPRYDDVIAEVAQFLRDRVDAALAAGVDRERIIVDPGIGFGKDELDNVSLLAGVRHLRELGFPLLVGPSRKRFIGELTGVKEPRQRLAGTIGAVCACVLSGVELVRVHDVQACSEAAKVCFAIRKAGAMDDIRRGFGAILE